MASAAVADFLKDKGLADKYTVQQITLAVWAGTEGLMNLHQRKYFTYMGTTLEEMATIQLEVFLRGLE